MRGMRGGPGSPSPSRIDYEGVTLLQLITSAYGLPEFQVSGPQWISSSLYEIVANVPPGTTRDTRNLMLQNLLAERFQLKAHHETQTRPIYELRIAKSGSKLTESTDEHPKVINGVRLSKVTTGLDDAGAVHVSSKGATSPLLISVLRSELRAIVEDKTGLTGYYDIDLQFLTGAGDASSQRTGIPYISSALGDLGLTLEKLTTPVDVLVIDHIDKQPTSN